MEIHADFDTASLAEAKINGSHVSLSPVSYDFNDRPTGCWFAFRVIGAKGQSLTFSLDSSDLYMHGFDEDN